MMPHDDPAGTYTMAHAFDTILSRYSHTLCEDDYLTCEAYEDVLGASLVHYISINSPAADVSIMTSWTKNERDEDVRIATIAFDLIGDHNNHLGRCNVAKHIVHYLELARDHAANAEFWKPYLKNLAGETT